MKWFLLIRYLKFFLNVDYFASDNFFCPVADAVHGSDPCHLILGFQFLCDSLGIFHLGNDTIQPVLRLFIQICQICPEPATQNQVIILGWMILLQIVFVHPPPNPNRPGFFRQFQVGDVVIANQRIIQAVVFIVNMFFEFFHVVDLLILV